VACFTTNSVEQVHASNGRALGTWSAATGAYNTIAAAGFIYVTGRENPGKIYRINPPQAPGAVTEVANNVGANPSSITFDGLNLWTANFGTGPGLGSITRYNIVTDTATTSGAGFNQPAGIVFDGTHLWVVDAGDNALYRVNPADGAILETLPMGAITSTAIPVFDGANIWVPVSNELKVVSTSTPARLLATLTGNGLSGNNRAVAFDGERILVTNSLGNSVSLWKASSLTPLGNLDLGAGMTPFGVCSDGLHFWISADHSLAGGLLLRF
jgi:DNA-binding beta-propeller fold protein YncE